MNKSKRKEILSFIFSAIGLAIFVFILWNAFTFKPYQLKVLSNNINKDSSIKIEIDNYTPKMLTVNSSDVSLLMSDGSIVREEDASNPPVSIPSKMYTQFNVFFDPLAINDKEISEVIFQPTDGNQVLVKVNN